MACRGCAFRERAATLSAVLLDFTMPGMRGGEVLIELRRTHPTLPVIVVSDCWTRQTRRESSRKGPTRRRVHRGNSSRRNPVVFGFGNPGPIEAYWMLVNEMHADELPPFTRYAITPSLP